MCVATVCHHYGWFLSSVEAKFSYRRFFRIDPLIDNYEFMSDFDHIVHYYLCMYVCLC